MTNATQNTITAEQYIQNVMAEFNAGETTRLAIEQYTTDGVEYNDRYDYEEFVSAMCDPSSITRDMIAEMVNIEKTYDNQHFAYDVISEKLWNLGYNGTFTMIGEEKKSDSNPMDIWYELVK